jgi:hypothetical protein
MNIGGTGATDNCLVKAITGQSDYDANNNNQIILVKMNRSAGRDLFLMYNKKTGINSGTVEGGNLVTVVEANGEGTAYGESWLVAKLGAGKIYTASNYLSAGKDLVITVLSIGTTANVRIEYGGLCTPSTPNPTTPPSPNPTPVLTNPPTNSPSNPPTFSPPTSPSPPPPTPVFASTVKKYICTKNDPFASTICADGSLAGDSCSSENIKSTCGSKGRVCWWAECTL